MRMTCKYARAFFLILALSPLPAVADNLYLSGAVVAGSATAVSPSTGGDLEASRNASAGVLKLGGNSASCTVDYGATNLGVLTTSCVANFAQALKSTSAITAGSGSANSAPAAGDLQASRNTNTGALVLGGSTTSGTLDFGVNHVGAFNFGASVYDASAFYGGTVVVAGVGTAPASPTAGDLVASRSVSTGALQLGGSTTNGVIDFGVNHSGAFTIGTPFFGSNETLSGTLGVTGLITASGGISGTTGTFSGAATSPTIAKIYQDGTQLTTSPHVEAFTAVTIAATSTTTKSFGLAFAGTPSCTVSSHNYQMQYPLNVSGTPSTTQVVLQNGNSGSVTADVHCIGQ